MLSSGLQGQACNTQMYFNDEVNVLGDGRRPPERSRMDDRVDAPIRPMNRAPSQEWLTGSSLRPGGGAPRSAAEPTVSLRPGGPGAAGAGAGARSGSSSSLRCARFLCP